MKEEIRTYCRIGAGCRPPLKCPGIRVYTEPWILENAKVEAPMTPEVEEVFKGALNCQHCKADSFAGVVTIAVAFRKLFVQHVT